MLELLEDPKSIASNGVACAVEVTSTSAITTASGSWECRFICASLPRDVGRRGARSAFCYAVPRARWRDKCRERRGEVWVCDNLHRTTGLSGCQQKYNIIDLGAWPRAHVSGRQGLDIANRQSGNVASTRAVVNSTAHSLPARAAEQYWGRDRLVAGFDRAADHRGGRRAAAAAVDEGGRSAGRRDRVHAIGPAAAS